MRWSARLSTILLAVGITRVFAGAPPVTSDATWTGTSTSTHNWTDTSNWELTGSPAAATPANDGSLIARFSGSGSNKVSVNTNQSISNLYVNGSVPGGGYTFSGPGSLTIGNALTSYGTDLNGTGSLTTFDSSLSLIVNNPVTFLSNNEIDIYSVISGTGSITFTAASSAQYYLAGNSTFSGGSTINSGVQVLINNGDASALGTGGINLAGGELVGYQGALTLANAIAITASSQLVANKGNLTLTGQMTLNNNSVITDGGSGYAIYQTGGIGQGTSGQQLSLTGSNSFFIMSGSNNYSGGTYVANGSRAIFTTSASIPTTGQFTSNATGYIGTTLTGATDLTNFYSKFSPTGYIGTIGFDSAFGQAPTNFTLGIDLTAIPSAVIGSATTAILSGTINTGNTYKFGGGGGILTVSSTLLDNGGTPRSLSLQGNGNILTLHLTGTNTYTGGTTVTAGALIFDSMSALPTTGTINATSTNSYIGTSQALDSISGGAAFAQTFLSDFNKSGTHGIVGFDGSNGSVVSANLNLTTFNSGVYLGTTSAVSLAGTITTNDGNYYFTGVKGGALDVASLLGNQSGASSVTIGTVTPIRSSDTVNGGLTTSSVTLDSANTYTGGTKLDSGKLIIKNASALGTGALTTGTNVSPEIDNGTNGALTIANNLILANSVVLSLVNNGQQFEFSGTVTKNSTSALLDLYGVGGSNLFDQGIGAGVGVNVFTGSANFAQALQANAFDLAVASGATANFTSASSYVTSLSDTDAFNTSNGVINIAAGGTLHLALPSTYDMTFNGTITGSGSALEKSGTGFQALGGTNTYSGGTTIDGGVLAATSNGAFGSGSVLINPGAKLGIGPNVTLSNTILFGGSTSSPSTIGGFGTYAGALTLTSGAALAPGANTSAAIANANPTGALTIGGNLTFLPGSIYDWGIQTLAANGGQAGDGWGVLVVNGSVGSPAVPTAPFKLRITSFTNTAAVGALGGFDNTQSYSWTILTATGSLAGSLVTGVTIDTSQFSNTLGTGGFYLTESGSNLVLNFSPVPEPSTYALIAVGLGLGGAAWMIRRRRSA